jgi:transcription elongation factor Elf1
LFECPSCGSESTVILKSWPVTFKKQSQYYKKPKFFIGIFQCTECKTKFRARTEALVKPASTIQAEVKQAETPKLEDLVERARSIQCGLIQARKRLHEKLRSLETERGSLILELGDLQKDAESRAEELEDEICHLRDEIKSLKELLGSAEEEKD